MKNIVYILVCASVIFFTACSSQDKNKKDGTQVLMQDSTEIARPTAHAGVRCKNILYV